MVTSTGRLRPAVAGSPGDQTMEQSSYIRGTMVKHITLTLAGYSIVNGSSRKFSEQYGG